ncbi:MAG: hypothetical protein SFV17_14685 [Candidatus Obscuribacter sp.]|nr:hypothetical protein [Candidatus Obscuribacter sp.]
MISVLVVRLSLFLCCLLGVIFCNQSLPSARNAVLSAPGTNITCSLAANKQYLVFVQYKNRSGPGHFEVDNLRGTDAITAKVTFAKTSNDVPIQSFTNLLYFPGDGCTFRLVSAIWLDQHSSEKVSVQLKNLPSSLNDVRVIVVPWGQPVPNSSGSFMFVADSDLSPGHFILPRDFKFALITPMDLPRLNRFPILGFTCPIGLKCRKFIKKGEPLYPEYFELPAKPQTIRDLVQAGYAYRCWIIPDVVEHSGNSR